MARKLRTVFMAATVFTLFACNKKVEVDVSWTDAGANTEFDSDSVETSREDDCIPGTVSCPCAAGSPRCTGEDIGCIGGICRELPCEGAAGCACYANYTCNRNETGAPLVCIAGLCKEEACQQGSKGCGCFAGGVCNEGLYCDGAGGAPLCVTPDCIAGQLNCGCLPDMSCESGDADMELACREGVCVPSGCNPGEENCVCKGDHSCDAGLSCGDDFICVSFQCTRGSLSCGCRADDSCDDDLYCAGDNTCQSRTCPQGDEGCGCFGDFTCLTVDDNTSLICREGVCVRSECTAGTLGCECRADDSCSDGLACLSGFCRTPTDADGEDAAPPADPKCYSPCREGLLREDGTYVPCSAEGLMRGCIGGQQCQQGSCVPAGGERPTCQSDLACPDFQRCIQGFCYSECEVDSDCPSAKTCFHHVCRSACEAENDDCGEGTFCSTVDGETGHCLPLDTSPLEAALTPEGYFEISRELIEFTNNRTSGSFVITNATPVALEFTVRKAEHVEYSDDGADVITENPLHWLEMGPAGNLSQSQEFTVLVDGVNDEGAPGEATIVLESAHNDALIQWQGRIDVIQPDLGSTSLRLTYATKPDGQWSGTMYYFSQYNDTNVDEWLAHREEGDYDLERLTNAFLQRWLDFKGTEPGRAQGSFEKFNAMLTATRLESWKYENVQAMCEASTQGTATSICYMYDSPEGVEIFTADRYRWPVPSGVVELPISFNLKSSDTDPLSLSGRIVSDLSLQYAGNPAVSLRFLDDPTSCDRSADTCLARLDTLSAYIQVGGRYLSRPSDALCSRAEPGSFEPIKTPWLIPGFLKNADLDEVSDTYYSHECRDTRLPSDTGDAEQNLYLAASNPIPDGRVRRRTIELLDGALINQESLFIIFREHFSSFLGPRDTEGFSAYGYMLLRRNAADLEDEDFVGATAAVSGTEPEGILRTACSDELLEKMNLPLEPGTLRAVANAVVMGVPSTDGLSFITSESPESVHYLCEATGLIDGGPDHRGDDEDINLACEEGSKVTYFTVVDMTQDQIADEACQQDGSCQETLNQWVANGAHRVRLDPIWCCADEGGTGCSLERVYCDTERLDLRAEKLFFERNEGEAKAFVSLHAAVDNAFRYKTRFRTRAGDAVGFAPQICVPNSDAVPYCFDPQAIEEIQARQDCAADIYINHYEDLAPAPETREMLLKYLKQSFGKEDVIDPFTAEVLPKEGFEFLFAELLIMMGDESYTSAFAARMDLAGSNMVDFEGELFEPDGMNLSGGAGYEMYSLYQATQYYQMVLDRFYSLSPLIWGSIERDRETPGQGFITQKTVVTYFDRLVRASAQKARSLSEIAKRYQGFNRPDLAKRVVERAYASAYMESIVLSRMVLKLLDIQQPQAKDQIVAQLDHMQLTYRSALLDMRDVYADITEDVNFFGYPPDYIPFPALDPGDTNAIEKVLASTFQKMETAYQKENIALQDNRSYETDAASFQSELVTLRDNYENRLAEICGTMTGDDGRVYPAIPLFAHLNERAKSLGNPCGLMGNGMIHEAIVNLELAKLDFESVLKAHEIAVEKVRIEEQSVLDTCNLIAETAELKRQAGEQIHDLNDDIRNSQETIANLKRNFDTASRVLGLMKCTILVGTSTGGDCPAAVVISSIIEGLGIVANSEIGQREHQIRNKESEIEEIQNSVVYSEALAQCEHAKIEALAQVKGMWLDISQFDLDALKADYRIRLALSEVQKYQNNATRLIAEMEEHKQLLVDVEAAQNNPNVRIYKNDAIINADRTFWDAVREAYKATRVYEYYTSQSYSKLMNLFLVRMVAHGDYSLESYIRQLEDDYMAFEEQFGNPDRRVAVLSLRDDILNVPRYNDAGVPLTQSERVALFREGLADVKLLDNYGYLTVPFATSLASLSPLTRNHKIDFLEAEIVGSDVGDSVGRIYLRQNGTSMIRTIPGENLYYAFPEKTAVINPLFNGVKVFDPAVYRNERLKERPFVNTHFEIVFNQKDEAVNDDINLRSLTDVRLYLYYTDFTAF